MRGREEFRTLSRNPLTAPYCNIFMSGLIFYSARVLDEARLCMMYGCYHTWAAFMLDGNNILWTTCINNWPHTNTRHCTAKPWSHLVKIVWHIHISNAWRDWTEMGWFIFGIGQFDVWNDWQTIQNQLFECALEITEERKALNIKF